jgi:hypothetical protein
MTVPYDINTPEGRHAAASAGANTLSNTGPRWVNTASGPVILPNDFSEEDAQKWAESYDAAIATNQQALQQTAGLERRQIEAKIEDLKAGRENAMKIAQLQAETTRYGYDQSRQSEIDRLKENQRQFDQTHALDLQKFGLDTQRFGLEQQRFGLDTARAYTDYAKTPDMRWSANDFDQAIGRVGLGLQPQTIASRYAAGDRPQPKTWEDFSVLANYGPNGSGTGIMAPGGTADAPAGAPADTSQGGSAGGATGSTTDPRVTAANAVMKAIPPSPGVGHDDNNWAALNAIEKLYFSGDTPAGAVQQLGPARQKIALAGLARKGYDPQLAQEDYNRRQIGQGSSSAA